MIDVKLQSILEAVLFACGDPIELSKLSAALELDELAVGENLSYLADKYTQNNSGIRLLKLGDKYQLCSAAEFAPQIRAVMDHKRNTPLSQAAFEVLSIVAYNQPVTKAFIEEIRGVDCSAVIGSLCAKELIEEVGRLDLPGKPLVYGTTSNFLRCFSMESLGDLPKIPEPENEKDEESGSELTLND